ncbi:purine-nucleoside phosphorylase [Brevibacillus sp. NRS-1366]|uniref:phosphorylase family protein n=1 Tax=Brevibacillus sp. NRS-1366 TaxID=3233899 RepID=UPI003D190B47
MNLNETLSPVLKLERGKVAHSVIVCGDPARALHIAQRLDSFEQVAARREYVVYTGEKNGCRITVAAHGVGAAGAAICFEELIRYGAGKIIRIGTSGSYDDTQSKGDAIIATGATAEDGVSNALVPAGFPCVCNVDLVQSLMAKAKGKIQYRNGIVRTTSAFYPGVLDHKVEVWAAAGAVGIEMELATLLAIASIRRVKAAGIFVIDGFPLHDKSMEGHDQNNEIVKNGMDRVIDVALEAIIEADKTEGINE